MSRPIPIDWGIPSDAGIGPQSFFDKLNYYRDTAADALRSIPMLGGIFPPPQQPGVSLGIMPLGITPHITPPSDVAAFLTKIGKPNLIPQAIRDEIEAQLAKQRPIVTPSTVTTGKPLS